MWPRCKESQPMLLLRRQVLNVGTKPFRCLHAQATNALVASDKNTFLYDKLGISYYDPADSYEHSFLFDKLGMVSPEDFAAFIDSKTPVSQLVIMHLLVLEFVMSSKEVETGDKLRIKNAKYDENYDCRKIMARKWLRKILGDLPDEYRAYAAWVANFVKGLSVAFDSEDELWEHFLLYEGTTIEAGAKDTGDVGSD